MWKGLYKLMNRVTINGKTYTGGRSIVVVNNRVVVDGVDITDSDKDLPKTILTVKVEGVLGELNADGSVMADTIRGNAESGGSINCGSVGGDVIAGGSVNCGRVGGSVKAGGSVNHG